MGKSGHRAVILQAHALSLENIVMCITGTAVMKSTSSLPFKITETKFYILKNAAGKSPQITAEPHYNVSVSNVVPVLKKGQSIAQAPRQRALYTHQINEMKQRCDQPSGGAFRKLMARQ